MRFVTVWQQSGNWRFPQSFIVQGVAGSFFVNYLAILRVQAFDNFKLLHDTLMASSGVNPFDHSSILMSKKVSNLSGSLTALFSAGSKSSSEIIRRISADSKMLECPSFHSLGAGIAPRVLAAQNVAAFFLNSFQNRLTEEKFVVNQDKQLPATMVIIRIMPDCVLIC